jgi:hypothetical protein
MVDIPRAAAFSYILADPIALPMNWGPPTHPGRTSQNWVSNPFYRSGNSVGACVDMRTLPAGSNHTHTHATTPFLRTSTSTLCYTFLRNQDLKHRIALPFSTHTITSGLIQIHLCRNNSALALSS